MSVRYEGSFTVTADSDKELEEHKASILSHPKVMFQTMAEDKGTLSLTFSYDATVD